MEEKVGLFVDSFPLLHSGYELCLKYAMQQVDKLIAIVYDNSETKIPLTIRAEWIRKLYPNVDVYESWSSMEGENLTSRFSETIFR